MQDCTWLEMVRTPTFWLLYLMFTAVATGGLMATAQLGPIARDFKVADTSGSWKPIFGVAIALDWTAALWRYSP